MESETAVIRSFVRTKTNALRWTSRLLMSNHMQILKLQENYSWNQQRTFTWRAKRLTRENISWNGRSVECSSVQHGFFPCKCSSDSASQISHFENTETPVELSPWQQFLLRFRFWIRKIRNFLPSSSSKVDLALETEIEIEESVVLRWEYYRDGHIFGGSMRYCGFSLNCLRAQLVCNAH